jgi:long-chain fatty acid transport protein
MRKLFILFAGILMTGSLFAGGLVTNTNQSARYTRFLSRNASTGLDAVYYNPAGLTRLGNGFFLSLNNQTIGQTKTVTSDYPYLTGAPKDYVGKVSAPFFPGIYADFNVGRFSLSAGFNPIGGGGGAKYDTGLPSFEMQVADLVPLLVSQGIPTTAYSADIFFEGTSTYFGYQVNAAYELSDWLSVAAGIRLVTAKNTYNGSMKNIMINPTYPVFGSSYNGSPVLASQFFTDGATFINTLASGATLLGTGLQQIIAGGGGSVLLSDGTSAGLSAAQILQIQGILVAAGLNPASITIAQAQGMLAQVGPVFAAKATTMANTAAQTQDVYVDASRSGMGYTPTISVNLSPASNLNIAVRYDFKTKLDLTTKVNDNKSGGIFTDGSTVIADMPAMLAAGIEYKPMDKLLVSASMNYYFDKQVDWDGSESLDVNMIDKNSKEFALGVEYGITDKFRVSAGWLGTFTGVNSFYQNDQTFSLNTNSIGAGIGLRLTDMIDLNLGGMYTFYQESTDAYQHMLGTTVVDYNQTYNKKTWVVAVGLDFRFGGK